MSRKSEAAEPQAVSRGTPRSKPSRSYWEELGVPLAVLALTIFFSLNSSSFLTMSNWLNIGRQTAALAILAWAQTMIIISAGIDLSAGSVIAISSMVMASVVKSTGSEVGILAGLAIGVAAGFLNGVLIAKLRVPAFIATLAMMSIARGAAVTLTAGVPIFGLESKLLPTLGNGDILGVPVSVLVAAATYFAMHFLLTRTKMGTYTYAIGGNEMAAAWSGVPVARYKVLIYTVAGLLTGIAAILLTGRVNSGQPLLASGIELQVIAAVCIGGTSLFGGKGRLSGTLFGVLLIGVLNNGLNLMGISSFVQQIIIGIAILLAVLSSVWRRQ